MNMKSSARPTLIRRCMNGVNRATFGLSGRFAEWFDQTTGGSVTAFGHRTLYQARQFGLRSRAAVAGRDVRLLSEPRSKDIGVAEGGDRNVDMRGSARGAAARSRKRDGRQTILFASEMRPVIAGNLLRIRDRIYERGLGHKFDVRFSFRTLDQVTPEGTAQLASDVAAADIILIDDYFPLLNKVTLRDDQKLIQVWHAGSGFKSVGYSRFGNYGSPRLTDTHRKYTFAICGSTHLVPVYAEVFGIPENAVIPTGLPRIDAFLDPIRSAHVKADFVESYPELVGKKKILFAPTFRGEGAKTAFYDYSRLDFERIYEMCGDEYVFLMRMHHFIAEAPPIPEEYADRILDFSHFPDGNDLLHSVDILITDYSSILYEFSLLERPMLFFAYDKDLYSATRGFHRAYEEMAPGKVCTTMSELIESIEAGDFEEWKIERFREENFDHIDTSSSDRVIDQLILDDPRDQPEAIEAEAREFARYDLARRLAAEQFHVDHPAHAPARRAVESFLRLDREAEVSEQDEEATETEDARILVGADDREVLS